MRVSISKVVPRVRKFISNKQEQKSQWNETIFQAFGNEPFDFIILYIRSENDYFLQSLFQCYFHPFLFHMIEFLYILKYFNAFLNIWKLVLDYLL